MDKPKVVCLCGSTKFYEQFQEANYKETMAGSIILSVGFYPHRLEVHNQTVGCTEEQKAMLDELHKRKIDLADEIFVLNVGGYIGDSTRGEIEYAKANNKSIRYLEDPPVILKTGGLKLWYNNEDFVVAESAEEATQILIENSGCKEKHIPQWYDLEKYQPDIMWGERDAEEISIRDLIERHGKGHIAGFNYFKKETDK